MLLPLLLFLLLVVVLLLLFFKFEAIKQTVLMLTFYFQCEIMFVTAMIFLNNEIMHIAVILIL
jgi:hypothetical protein